MIKHTRMYELLLAKFKTEIIAVPAAYALRSFFRGKLLFDAPCKKNILKKQSLEVLQEQMNAVFKKPQYDGGNYPPLSEGDDTVLSVIIPAYNAERFLGECLKSIFANKPSFKFEVIVVNDGSKDNTAKAVEPYLENKELIYIEQENSGVSAARNNGIEIAKGKYITFADADDMVIAGGIDKLVDVAEKTESEIVVGSWKCCNEAGKISDEYKMPDCCYTDENMADMKEISGVPWGKIYKRELFSQIRFPENYSSYVDTNIRFLVFREAKKIACSSEYIYLWRRTASGITSTSKKSMRSLQTYWIIEDMVAENDRIGLKKDLMFYVILLTQLSYVNYNRLRGMDDKFRQLVFSISCAFYEKYSSECPAEELPWALNKVHQALVNRDFGMWNLVGKNYRMIS